MTTYIHSLRNSIHTPQPSKAIRWLLVAFFVFNLFLVSAVFAQNGPNCPSGICIGPGGSINSGSLTITSNSYYSSIIVKNGTTLTVKSGVTLYVGQVGTAFNTQVVDFQNGCFVVIESGASLVVNGLLNNSNNSNGVTINGSVSVTGNVTAGNGSTIVGTGTVDTSGTINTNGTGSIFESTGDCLAGPCSGSQLNCSGETNTISGNQTICSGNTTTTLIGSTTLNPATYQWQNSTTTGANFVDISGATSPNYSPGSLTTTTYYRRKKTVGGCTGTSAQVAVIVNTAPSSPTGSSSQSFCSGATVANLVASGTAIKWYATASGGTALATTSPLVNNTHYYASQTIGCESTSRLDVTATVNATNTWTGTTSTSWFTAANWSCSTVPTASSDVTIPNVTNKPFVDGAGTIALANTLTVDSGSSLTVNSGNTLKVTDKVTNNSGSMTFEDSASLLQINNVTNSGNITYKRIAPSVRKTDYTYWSSPVSPLKLAGVGGISYSPVSLAGSIFYSYLVTASSENWQSETATTTMIPGQGYSIRAAGAISLNPPSFLESSFTGVPNNGTYAVAIAKSGASYLLGNPYPSAIDADKFIVANSTVIDGTLYFWTHNTPIAVGTPDPGTGVYAYSGNDYATYTLSGGVGTSGNFNDINGNGVMDTGEEVVSNRPTGKIAAGQGFFTTSTAAGGNVNFTNAMRVDGSSNPLNNSNFYKTKNPKAKTTTTIEKNRVWLNLTNKEGAFKQTLVGYITGATNTWDKLYDGESFDGNDFLDFYSINEDKNLTIQGRALPFDTNDEIPLGYRIAVEGNFTISIDETDGLLSNQEVFLEDKLANKTVNLKQGNYTFNTAAGTFNDRFVLRYSNKTLGTTDFDIKENSVLVSIKNKQIKINSFVDTIEKVTIFDLLGRKLYQKDKINSNEFLLTDLRASHETLIVKTSLQNGKTVSEKIIF